MRKRRYDDATLILAGGIAAALIGAAGASSWVWLRQRPGETGRAHRHRATQATTLSFGIAGALGAAAAAALLGPRAAGEKDWRGVLEKLSEGVADLRKRAEAVEIPALPDLRKSARNWLH